MTLTTTRTSAWIEDVLAKLRDDPELSLAAIGLTEQFRRRRLAIADLYAGEPAAEAAAAHVEVARLDLLDQLLELAGEGGVL